jgi:hypothetical protein
MNIHELNKTIADIEGVKVVEQDGWWIYDCRFKAGELYNFKTWDPCDDWSVVGPLMAKNGISLKCCLDSEIWTAYHKDLVIEQSTIPTVAICLAIKGINHK